MDKVSARKMAKVCGVTVGFCVIFLFNLDYCNSYTNQNNYDLYEVDGVQYADFLSVHNIQKRQTLPEYKQINAGTPPEDVKYNAPLQNKEDSDVKQEPPGVLDSGGNGNASVVDAASLPSIHEKQLLGVNGTGQRKDYTTTKKPEIVSEPINPVPKVTKLSTPKKVNVNATDSMTMTDTIIDEVDQPENNTRNELTKYNITEVKEDFHLYYNSSVLVDKELIAQYWNEFKNITPNSMLSKSHRRAMTVHLSFDFPFYGHLVRNVTVATGGFLYTGEYVHSWLAATQYIAPLMANFDTSLSEESFVKFVDNGTSFTVLWEKVALQDKPEVGTFTFATTLHKTGDIVFTYFSVPIEIEAIQDDKHPVKVGLSDAYIIDKYVFFARRKTIYEYHRVNFQSPHIQNDTIIYLAAQRTCLSLNDCVSCISEKLNFDCNWCPTLNKCSTGTDRKRQEWLKKGCDRTVITEESFCPALGEKGNNAAQQTNDTAVASNWESNLYSNSESMHNVNDVTRNAEASQMGQSEKENDGKRVGLVLGFMLPICLIMSALLWVFYAYRNPHTKSGQLLIQYRPSQWTWRRGEARYTAATIHM
ncbi:plexin domain-containing protein 2 isoform X2 [Hermetia illucens]|uniref:plexin domain-containing protein 2 isoform X2 n=1 Tax=Hermetia illucens TaxID=343691 RepID=UPI0018CBF314|nr:plexin domain-containing protein 2 isoform X2 [Hermetia illucens]